jgi:hypothetical protein
LTRTDLLVFAQSVKIPAWSLSVLATFIVLSKKINGNIYTQLNAYNMNEKAESPSTNSEMYLPFKTEFLLNNI